MTAPMPLAPVELALESGTSTRAWKASGALSMRSGTPRLATRAIPSAALFVMPNTGHTLNIEEPDMFNRAIAELLPHFRIIQIQIRT